MQFYLFSQCKHFLFNHLSQQSIKLVLHLGSIQDIKSTRIEKSCCSDYCKLGVDRSEKERKKESEKQTTPGKQSDTWVGRPGRTKKKARHYPKRTN